MTERKCEWLDGEEFQRILMRWHDGKTFFAPVADFIRARVEEEIREEREACAKECEKTRMVPVDEWWNTIGKAFAAAIRARGGEK